MDYTCKKEHADKIVEIIASLALTKLWEKITPALPLCYGFVEPFRTIAKQINMPFCTDNNGCSVTIYYGKYDCLHISSTGDFVFNLPVDVVRELLPMQDFHGMDLRGRKFAFADLRFADLRGADLRGADLEGSHLECADLRGADLRGAKINFTHWDGADFSGVKMDKPFSAVHSKSQMWFSPPSGEGIELYDQA